MNVPDRRTWQAGVAADIGLGVVFFLLLAVTAVAIAVSWGGSYWQFGFAAGAVATVITLTRRFHLGWASVACLVVAGVAVVVATIADLPQEPGPAMIAALAVLVGSAVRSLSTEWAAGIAAGGLAVVVGCWVSGGYTAVAVFTTLGWLVAVAAGLSVRLLAARRRAEADIVRRNERLELARELHDVAAHHITGIVLQAQAAQLVARKRPEELNTSLAGIEVAGSEALAAMRRVVGLLRDVDDAAPATPGPEQLSELVSRFDGHGPAVHLRLPEGESTWPPEVTSTIYRIVQESLTNISRHAPHARSVTVTVTQDDRAITVEVADDAPPAPTRYAHLGGYGLVGMRERVETLGGTLQVGPRPEAGWSVLATLPVAARGAR